MFESVEDVQARFRDARYIASRRISTVVYLAARMGRPVLVEGPAGVGKTELAKTLSDVTRRRLIRLQCYEGLDEGKASTGGRTPSSPSTPHSCASAPASRSR